MKLPDGWNQVRFGEIAEFKNGINYKSTDKGVTIKFLGVGDFQDRYLIRDINSLQTIELKEIPNENHLLKNGDLVFVRSNGNKELVGRCISVYPNNQKLTYSGFSIRARINKPITTPEFVNTLMQNGSLKKILRRDGRGTNISNLNQTMLSRLFLILPTFSEQKTISELLSTWDETIGKTEKLIAEKEKRQRQISKWLIFGHRRLEKSPVAFIKEKFFQYPSDWSLILIGEIAKEISKKNGDSNVAVLSCSKYNGFVNSLDYFGKKVFSNDTSNYKVIRKGQFGYPSNHIEEGSIGLLEHCDKGIVSPIYIVFENFNELVHPPYLFKLLKTDVFKHIFKVRTSSSVDRRGSLRWNEFSKIKILLPSLDEQKEIVELINFGQQEIELLKQLNEKYKMQKRGLMQKLLTGEWRVKPEILNKYKEK